MDQQDPDYEDILDSVIDKLCEPDSYLAVTHRHHHDMPMPSVKDLKRAVDILKGVLFPGYFWAPELTPATMRYHVGAMIDEAFRILADQVRRGFCFTCPADREVNCEDCELRARNIATRFVERLPHIRAMLTEDVKAAYAGDPAARSPGETIFCYPSINAVTKFRIAHELHLLGVDLIPRIITEIAHSENGIDLHPGAVIGERFFLDHGTGVVIGETCEIGRNVRIYQGVTLGAKSFPLDANGNPIKGIPRHPMVEDDVIIYSGATILGRVTIGRGAVIGGNMWVTEDVPAGARLLKDGRS